MFLNDRDAYDKVPQHCSQKSFTLFLETVDPLVISSVSHSHLCDQPPIERSSGSAAFFTTISSISLILNFFIASFSIVQIWTTLVKGLVLHHQSNPSSI